MAAKPMNTRPTPVIDAPMANAPSAGKPCEIAARAVMMPTTTVRPAFTTQLASE